MKKFLAALSAGCSLSGLAHADDAAIKQSLANLGMQQRDPACSRHWDENGADQQRRAVRYRRWQTFCSRAAV